MLRPSLWFVTGQNAVCYDQVDDLLLVRMLYVTTKFMICYRSKHCMLQQVYDLLLVRTLYSMTKFMICYRSKHCMLRPSLWFVTGQNTMLRPSLWFVTGQNTMLRPSWWFVTGQNTVCYDQVYDLLLVRTLYGMTKFMIG